MAAAAASMISPQQQPAQDPTTTTHWSSSCKADDKGLMYSLEPDGVFTVFFFSFFFTVHNPKTNRSVS